MEQRHRTGWIPYIVPVKDYHKDHWACQGWRGSASHLIHIIIVKNGKVWYKIVEHLNISPLQRYPINQTLLKDEHMVRLFRTTTAQTTLPPEVQTYLHAPRLPERVPWREVDYAVLDLETTGLNARRDAILSIGLVEVRQGRVQLDSSWYALVQPPAGVQVPAASIRIHGLLRGDVAHAPHLTDVLPELLERLAGRVLVVHFARMDVDFLARALQQTWRVQLRGPALDTMQIAQGLYHQERWLTGHDGMRPVTSLRELAEQVHLPIANEHNALSDAITTAQLFLAQAIRLERRGNGSLQHLLQMGRCLR